MALGLTIRVAPAAAWVAAVAWVQSLVEKLGARGRGARAIMRAHGRPRRGAEQT